MKIIEVAREQKDLLNEGIAYIAVWQRTMPNGKQSWFAEDFFPVDSKDEKPVFDSEQKLRLKEISEIDGNAVLLNGYCHAWIGSADEPLNAANISVGIKKHYEQHNYLISEYLENGIQSERKSNDSTITIEIPFTSCGDLTQAKKNLADLIQSKTTLIKAALGENSTGELPLEFTETTVKFEWLNSENIDSTVIQAWSAFLNSAVSFSKKSKRITAKDTGLPENPKFAMRTLCVKIGLNDPANKAHRKTLLQNLSGDSAFATPESKAKWQAKHLKKAK